jgi:hypothetical protein
MACETMRSPGQTLQERMTQVERALKRLEQYLSTGSARVMIAPNGAVAFANWQDRDNVSDVCAYRALAAGNSWALRQAVAKAEAQSGRKVNARAVAAGFHSHDNGHSWGKH